MEIVPLVLGWLFGVLSPVVISRFRHDFKKHDLHAALLKELENMHALGDAKCFAQGRHPVRG